MLRFTKGDMFETPADIRVNTVNCVGVMGAGVALAFKTRYPDMFDDYKQACEAGEVQPGKLHIWKNLTGDWIINFPTKRHWRENSRYEDIEAGLVELRAYLSKQGKVSIVLPALGCGHGGLDWARVSKMIQEHLENLAAEITVFEPADSRAAGQKVLAEMLEAEGIKMVPLRGAGASDWPFRSHHQVVYIKGDPALLEQPAVAFACSSRPKDREREAATACLDALADEQVVLSLNYDALLEQTLEKGIEKGAHFVIWVSEGLMNFRPPKYLQTHLSQGSLALASVVNPRQRWNQGAFDETQAVSLKLGTVGVITEPRPKWIQSDPDGFRKWLDSSLFYFKYKESDRKTQELMNHVAAKPLGKNPKTNQPNVSPILHALAQRKETAKSTSPPSQEISAISPTEPPVLREEAADYQAESQVAGRKRYPKRLIEVDLPIKRISEHARREKSIRHGHISTLHIWWARRPLAACRAVICAALWPDPADPDCPPAFRQAAGKTILEFARKITSDTKLANEHCSPENYKLWQRLLSQPSTLTSQPAELRSALLNFIADFANWDNSTVKEYLESSRALTQAAHEALGGAPGTRPLVVDPFAGGGSIPVEALRVGADAFASDLNPIPVLLNKVVLEYIPKYGQRLADEIRKWGEWIKTKAEKELAEFYPKDADGATPIAYLWARTIQCEGPGCGAEVPLIRSFWLAKKPNRSVALQLVPNPRAKRVEFQIIVKQHGIWVDQDDSKTKIEDPKLDGTVKRGSATCPCCGYTTPVTRVREQLKTRRAGTFDARQMCAISEKPGENGAKYRTATTKDASAPAAAEKRLAKATASQNGGLSPVPDESYPDETASGALSASVLYGLKTWGDLFPSRPALALAVFSDLVKQVPAQIKDLALAEATTTCLAFCVSKLADYLSSLCVWRTARSCAAHTFGRQALPMAWDFAEMNPFAGSAGDWTEAVRYLGLFVEANITPSAAQGTTAQSSATRQPLPDDSAQALCTDPPYYDAIAYGDLSDFFYVWLRRILADVHPSLFSAKLTNKNEEIVQLSKRFPGPYRHKTPEFFESMMTKALLESRRIVQPSGVGVVVFAHKSTAGWEAMLQSLIDAGWIVTGSWTIDTERGGRLNSNDAASLASSVHIVCRPRENPDGSVRTDEIGDWRDVLQELPRRIHEWMPRLAEEGVVGADAIFACLGPALEVFSRYSRVEKASGEPVTLKEYLEQVWAAVAKEALNMIFTGADATGFEEDGRLTAMWLWTLKGAETNGADPGEDEVEPDEKEEGKNKKATGFSLEYDAARKIAQGLGAHLEDLQSLVEISGETARLLPVAERANHLFGKDEGKAAPVGRKREPQMDLFKAMQQADGGGESTFGEAKIDRVGKTVLDRIHQTMILFAAGRGEALKRFLVEDGVGNDQRFWRLAQALSALYPTSTEEKRWVDGVLARKKGLGF